MSQTPCWKKSCPLTAEKCRKYFAPCLCDAKWSASNNRFNFNSEAVWLCLFTLDKFVTHESKNIYRNVWSVLQSQKRNNRRRWRQRLSSFQELKSTTTLTFPTTKLHIQFSASDFPPALVTLRIAPSISSDLWDTSIPSFSLRPRAIQTAKVLISSCSDLFLLHR